MITSFDCFYGGHVEMDNLGFEGLPVDKRIESDPHNATVLEEARSFAHIMDETGYDTLWLAEHHFQREGYGGIPNIPMLAVYLSQVTKRLKYGCMFNTVPAWHPLRLAEDYAMADVLTEGRFRFGIGRGYIAREVETLGSPLDDDEANRELFEEQVDIIFKAWNESSFSHHGKHYDLPAPCPHRLQPKLEEITLVPRPIHLPVECWQPIFSASPRGIDFMVKHGIKGVVPGGGRAMEIATKWQEGLARRGRDTKLGEDLALVLQIHMADTEEEAMAEATPWSQEQFKVLAPWAVCRRSLRNRFFQPTTARRRSRPDYRPSQTECVMAAGSADQPITSTRRSARSRIASRAWNGSPYTRVLSPSPPAQ